MLMMSILMIVVKMILMIAMMMVTKKLKMMMMMVIEIMMIVMMMMKKMKMMMMIEIVLMVMIMRMISTTTIMIKKMVFTGMSHTQHRIGSLQTSILDYHKPGDQLSLIIYEETRHSRNTRFFLSLSSFPSLLSFLHREYFSAQSPIPNWYRRQAN